MTEIMLATVAVALGMLMFSDAPFIQLVYFFGASYALDWETWGVVTGMNIIFTYGATAWRKIKNI